MKKIGIDTSGSININSHQRVKTNQSCENRYCTNSISETGSLTSRAYILPAIKRSSISFTGKIPLIKDSSEPSIQDYKISMISKPNKVTAFIPDFSLPDEELTNLGLQKEKGKWYVPNREWFPEAIKEDDIVVNYGGYNANGTPNIGHYPKGEFAPIYVMSQDYDRGIIKNIDVNKLKKGKIINATKCASGAFCVLPENTKVKTNSGITMIKPGQVLIINDAENNVFVGDIKDSLLKRYLPDSMNPSSKTSFELLSKFSEDTPKMGTKELSEAHDALCTNFKNIQRGLKLYTTYNFSRMIEAPKSLRGEFSVASAIVEDLDKEIFNKIDALDFDTRLKQAKGVLESIISNNFLTESQKNLRIAAVQVRLLPKTNNHQHLKGSVPKETLLEIARNKHFSNEQIENIEQSYRKGKFGFKDLSSFNSSYATIGSPIQTPHDYKKAISGIIKEATKQGQLALEIRCSVIGPKDAKGNPLDPDSVMKNILDSIKESRSKIEKSGGFAPKVGFTLLGYRGKDWHPEEVIEHAKLATKYAKLYPDMKFGFDLAGPEDSGYKPSFFKEGFDILREHNSDVVLGKSKGQKIGITIHAGETPTCDGNPGYLAVQDAIKMGADRIGHGVQAVTDEKTMSMLKKSGATVEICGVCNVSSIPVNTFGFQMHPVQEFIKKGIPVTICTDNDAICGTNISKEYMEFLLTGHDSLMSWTEAKKVAENGLKTSFLCDEDKKQAFKVFHSRIRKIEKLITEVCSKKL